MSVRDYSGSSKIQQSIDHIPLLISLYCKYSSYLYRFFSPFTSAWPHLRCDVGLEEGEYRENCLCLAVLCIIIMVHKDTSSSYRAVNCIGL